MKYCKPWVSTVFTWTSAFSYAVGLIASDGNLSSSGRHISFVSKDEELVRLFRMALNLKCKIGRTARGHEQEKKYFRAQFSSVHLYRILLGIGLTSRKSKTINELYIPDALFFDFLRGFIDGDGNIQEFKHPESKNPQLRVRLFSASRPFLEWINEATGLFDIQGSIMFSRRVYTLSYPMNASKRLLNLLYYPGFEYALQRKYIKARKYLRA